VISETQSMKKQCSERDETGWDIRLCPTLLILQLGEISPYVQNYFTIMLFQNEMLFYLAEWPHHFLFILARCNNKICI
jgi:hypothetical protein